MSDPVRVLFASKPIEPPSHDGTVCLVRELVEQLHVVQPTVMTLRGFGPPNPRVSRAEVYASPHQFAPQLRANARVLQYLLLDRSHDIWHFVFAPNPRSCAVAQMLRRVRRVRVVQTIASRPKSFRRGQHLLFGDRIVALSRHTQRELQSLGAAGVRLIPPPLADIHRTPEQQAQARAHLHLPLDRPMVLYAGDWEEETSVGTIAQAAPIILREEPDTLVVFACRAKTQAAGIRQRAIAQRLAPLGSSVRFVGEVPDLPSLMATAAVAPFVLRDLYGKVDLPYAALEACLLGVPILVSRETPLEDIEEAPRVTSGDARAVAAQCLELIRDANARTQLGSALRHGTRIRHDPARVAAAHEEMYRELLRA